ncbi:lysis protein [Pseudomonas juntendi]|uniref:lysis protein n=1 Tax=Pseudomonas juntendi TaxID=2666183 RepID=UPI001F4917E4|nr:lysis protein [Pseudomonas juntendi]MCO7058333.1 lysis protein [Pseudomonas juntendi]UJM10723.1 lysis protein [Pseudomonas juntendi]UXA40689.1 lysis system i-spanin subunit Rz [Pseudomonas juntendi]
MSVWITRLVFGAALLIACAAGARAAWVWQANVYKTQLAEQTDDFGRQLAAKDRTHGLEREKAAAAALDQLADQQGARRALEDRLQAQAQTHWKEMEDAQETQALLRDRLATADLRLSVLVDAGALAATGCDGGVRKAPGTGGVVHGAVRAQLDRANAQRIVAITDEGDRGLIALNACQAYIRALSP